MLNQIPHLKKGPAMLATTIPSAFSSSSSPLDELRLEGSGSHNTGMACALLSLAVVTDTPMTPGM